MIKNKILIDAKEVVANSLATLVSYKKKMQNTPCKKKFKNCKKY